ncbi:MAG: L-2-amino-thiazoline-4-carboxylic acid hydrolase [Promethearchaeota archaeon]
MLDSFFYTCNVVFIVIASIILVIVGYTRLWAKFIVIGFISGVPLSLVYLFSTIVGGVSPFDSFQFFTYLSSPITISLLILVLLLKLRILTFFANGDKPVLSPLVIRSRMLLSAVKILKKKLPVKSFFKVLKIYMKSDKEDLWKNLPAENGAGMDPGKEAGTRDQLGDAVLIYRALLALLPETDADEIARLLIKEAAMAFLHGTVPVLSRDAILSMSGEEREEMMSGVMDRFPNTIWVLAESTETSFFYKIMRCRFPELLESIGERSLADAFCAADIEYFNKFQEDIILERDQTIAGGGCCCNFRFRLRQSTD